MIQGPSTMLSGDKKVSYFAGTLCLLIVAAISFEAGKDQALLLASKPATALAGTRLVPSLVPTTITALERRSAPVRNVHLMQQPSGDQSSQNAPRFLAVSHATYITLGAAFVTLAGLWGLVQLRRPTEPFNFACYILVRGQELKTIVVAGGTGRTGKLVVDALLARDSSLTVRALVRNQQKASELLPQSERLQLVVCNLANESQVKAACEGADAVIWCATGFSSGGKPLDTLRNLFGVKVLKRSVDSIALKAIGEAMKLPPGKKSEYPRVVMCSSAGVTRTIWSEEKKQRLVGAADIPIVRLNPFGVLDLKRDSEQVLRDTGVSYTIVRPTGLNAQLETGRPIFSQGDIAVGRISRVDVAQILVSMLVEEAECIGKTFEVLALPGLPSPRSFQQQLGRLLPDSQPLDEEFIQAQYNILQQLLPGETLEANQLAMGQTYEQLDRGETGRFGKKGEEVVPGAQNFGGQ